MHPNPCMYFSLNMYVEDKTSYNGPIQVSVKSNFTVADLKEHVQCEFDIPVGVQRWILEKSLAEDDNSTLSSHGITQNGQTIYLYLVAPKQVEQIHDGEKENDTKAMPTVAKSPKVVQRNPVAVNGTHKKGRYWNYEMDRWSYCSDSEDEEIPPRHETDFKDEKIETNDKAAEAVQDDKDDDDYEWEYFYEDAEPADPIVEPKVPERLKNLAAKTAAGDGGAGGWICPTCTLKNDNTRPGCAACTTERPKKKDNNDGDKKAIPEGAVAGAAGTVKKKDVKADATVTKEKDTILNNYKKLDDLDVIPNAEPFECIICYLDIEPGDGVVLRECLHTFCR